VERKGKGAREGVRWPEAQEMQRKSAFAARYVGKWSDFTIKICMPLSFIATCIQQHAADAECIRARALQRHDQRGSRRPQEEIVKKRSVMSLAPVCV